MTSPYLRQKTLTQRYGRCYKALKAVGHHPFKAAEIILDAKRRVPHALAWVRIVTHAARDGRKAVRL